MRQRIIALITVDYIRSGGLGGGGGGWGRMFDRIGRERSFRLAREQFLDELAEAQFNGR